MDQIYESIQRYQIEILIGILIICLFLIWRQRSREPSLYERLGGIYAIAAVVDDFSDALIKNPVVGKGSPNPQLANWSKDQTQRLPGLKWMRTLWVAAQAGGPYKYIPTVAGKCPFSLENAHMKLKISPAEFDAVAAELMKSLDKFGVPQQEKSEILAVFAAHKNEVIYGYDVANGIMPAMIKC